MKRMQWIVALTVLLALLPAGLAQASPPINATGTVLYLGSAKNIYSRGQHCVLELDAHHDLTGTIEASCDTQMRIIHHTPCPPGGQGTNRENWLAHAVCTGTVAGRQGTFELHWTAQTDPNGDPTTAGEMVLSGTGDLSNLHGVLEFSANANQPGTYQGFVHFDPAP
jgi:hypothetical protein